MNNMSMSSKLLLLVEAAASLGSEGNNEDFGALIYGESQLRKKEAANVSAADKRNSSHQANTDYCNTNPHTTVDASKSSSNKRKRHSLGYQEQVPTITRSTPSSVASVRKKYNRKMCSAEGCDNLSRGGGVCIRHGAAIKLCSSDGCTNIAVKGGVCKRHGANPIVKQCSREGCTKKAQQGGVCIRHGAKVKPCRIDGCNTNAKRGGVCTRHGSTLNLCSSEGCTNYVQNGGVCINHGTSRAKWTKCAEEPVAVLGMGQTLNDAEGIDEQTNLSTRRILDRYR